MIQWISNIPDHPVSNIDAPLLTPTRYVSVRPRVEVNIQRRREIREIEEMLGLRKRQEATRKVIPKTKVSSLKEGQRARKIREIKEIIEKAFNSGLVKQSAHCVLCARCTQYRM